MVLRFLPAQKEILLILHIVDISHPLSVTTHPSIMPHPSLIFSHVHILLLLDFARAWTIPDNKREIEICIANVLWENFDLGISFNKLKVVRSVHIMLWYTIDMTHEQCIGDWYCSHPTMISNHLAWLEGDNRQL
jgi:hypothetical protein